VRLQRECLNGDVFGSLHCNCGEQTRAALETLAREGKGALIYMRQEGHKCGWGDKAHPPSPQSNGLDHTGMAPSPGVELDFRRCAIYAQILLDLRVRKLRLLTNHAPQAVGLSRLGLEVAGWAPLTVRPEHEVGLALEGRRLH
jgi:3,4-dihydroxy 2-butanone 4-phosphate synthase/GTP cyclohydrolase II